MVDFMDDIIAMLEDICPTVDIEHSDSLVDDGVLDSFAIVSLVGDLNDKFDIEITPADIVPENFNSVQAIWNMVQRLQEE
jgi:D-alanine--poly(phosphoribitol) ligase subunit 2